MRTFISGGIITEGTRRSKLPFVLIQDAPISASSGGAGKDRQFQGNSFKVISFMEAVSGIFIDAKLRLGGITARLKWTNNSRAASALFSDV
jgi:hypothetical protein